MTDSAVEILSPQSMPTPKPGERAATGELVVARKDWKTISDCFRKLNMPCMLYFREEILDYIGGAYRAIDDDTMKAWARRFLDECTVVVKNDAAPKGWSLQPFRPTAKDDQELFTTFKRHTNHPDLQGLENGPPCWLVSDRSKYPPPRDCIALRNGILDVRTHSLLPSTPKFFTRNALDFDYDPSATCPTWLVTLGQWWKRDEDGQPTGEEKLLQEMFGLFLVPDTTYQKIFAIVGATRGGKGVIQRRLKRLLGTAAGATTAQKICLPKGHEEVITQNLTMFPEFAIGVHDDAVVLTSFFKSVSGEDEISVGRMWKVAWQGTLLTRLLLFCNDTPEFRDDSGALAARLVVLRLVESFLDKEDLGLEAVLDGEVAGIFNWALEGLKRLRENGKFTMPESSLAAREEFERAASPIRTFVDDCCGLDAASRTSDDDLYAAYLTWCEESHLRAMSKTKFVKALTAHSPGKIKHTKLRIGFTRKWAFDGIAVSDEVKAKVTETAKSKIEERKRVGRAFRDGSRPSSGPGGDDADLPF